jgi:hypothetical protein
MGINFPSNPLAGQVYSAEGEDFVWTGAAWEVLDPTNFAYSTTPDALAGLRADVVMSPMTTQQALTDRGIVPSEGYGIPVDVKASRAEAVTYQNMTNRDLFWGLHVTNDVSCVMRISLTSSLASNHVARLLAASGRNGVAAFLIVPPLWYYRVNGSGIVIGNWWEW